jgi:hypothetical protein
LSQVSEVSISGGRSSSTLAADFRTSKISVAATSQVTNCARGDGRHPVHNRVDEVPVRLDDN